MRISQVAQWGKEPTCSAGDTDLIPGSERSPGEGNGNPLQYSCLENPWTGEPGSPWGHKDSDMTKQLHNNKTQHIHFLSK